MSNGIDVVSKINIFVRDSKVGMLMFLASGECLLEYESDWVSQGFPLSPALPFNGQYTSKAVINFLKNIFPEGQALEELLDVNRVSKDNIYAILSTIGHDTSGALVFADKPEISSLKGLRKVTESELISRLNKNTTRDLILWDGKYRLSIAGVQNKLNILIDKKGNMFLADGQYASSHIMKFASLQDPHITVNEFICMKLAKMVGLNVAHVQLKKMGDHYVLLVNRFDRRFVRNKVLKAHVVDGCQVMNLPPSFKYEQNFGSGRDVKHIRNGASLSGLFDFAERCSVPAIAKQAILDWIIFNVLIGNSDAHGKNISFLVGKSFYELAPFYDLLSIVYEANNNKRLDTGLAMGIGDQFDINNVKAYDFLCMSDEVGVPFKQLKDRMYLICNKTLGSLVKVEELSNSYDASVKNIFGEIEALIRGRCEQLIIEFEQLDSLKNSVQ